LFINNWVGWQLTKWLVEEGTDIVAAVLHPPHVRKFGPEIESVLKGVPTLDASQLADRSTINTLKRLNPDIGVSIYFGYILKPELLAIFGRGCVNLHPGLLPFNRGAHPNVWSIVEGTPAGVTLHWMDEGVDTGAIIAQQEVEVRRIDTGETLYRRLELEAVKLMQRVWKHLPGVELGPTTALLTEGTVHRTSELPLLDRIDPSSVWSAEDLINVIRARTFPPYEGAYLDYGDKRVYLRLELREGESA
jgi:methionyl-tRNA formyltransferase